MNANGGNRKRSVLIAEDTSNIRKLLSINLTIRNFTVYEAENGRQAVQILETVATALIVLDLKMPIMDGLEVCQWIREQGLTTPILALTAYGEDELREQILSMGADDYLLKPVSIELFLTRVQALLHRSER